MTLIFRVGNNNLIGKLQHYVGLNIFQTPFWSWTGYWIVLIRYHLAANICHNLFEEILYVSLKEFGYIESPRTGCRRCVIENVVCYVL